MADAKESSNGTDFELEVESDDDVPLAKKKQKASRYTLASMQLLCHADHHRGSSCVFLLQNKHASLACIYIRH